MTDKLWKVVERKIALYLGGERVPITGRTRGTSPDIEHKTFSIEVKHREELPEWILEAMEQAQASKRGDKIPLTVLHGKGMKYPDSLAVLKLSDLAGIMAKISKLENDLDRAYDEIHSLDRYISDL